MPSLVENKVVLEKKLFEFRQSIFAISFLSPLGKRGALHMNKIQSFLPKNSLWQVRLKLAQWFWRRRSECEQFTDERRTNRRTTGDKKSSRAFISGKLKRRFRHVSKISF